MSDNWIHLVPENPRHVPNQDRRKRAVAKFRQIAPDADEVVEKVSDSVTFVDCGSNMERILCPSCGEELDIDWWQDRLGEDSTEDGDGFKLAGYVLPCCQFKCTLNDLVYEWPQAFGSYVLEAMNANIGELKEEHRLQLEEILGVKLRVVYQHL